MKLSCNFMCKFCFALAVLCIFPLKAYSCDAIDSARSIAEKVSPLDNEQHKNLAIQLEKALLACAPPKFTRLVDDEAKTEPVTSADQIDGVWLSTLFSPTYTGLTTAKTFLLFVEAKGKDLVSIRYTVYEPHNTGFAAQKGKPFINIASAQLKLNNGVARAFDFHRNSFNSQSGPVRDLIHNLVATDFEGFTRLGLASPNMLLTVDAIASQEGTYFRPRTWVKTSTDTLDIMEVLSANGAMNANRPTFCLNAIVPGKRFERELSSHRLVHKDLVLFARETRQLEEDQRLLLEPDRDAAEKFGIELPAFMLEANRRYNDVDPKILAFLDDHRSSLPDDLDPLCPAWFANMLSDVNKSGEKAKPNSE